MTFSRIAFAAAFVTFGCATRLPPPTEPGPMLERPSAAIPADLDLAIRLDLDGLRRLFGPDIPRAIELGIVDSEKDVATAKLLSQALGDAHMVWIALRPGLPQRLTDNVVVLRGDFAHFDPRAAPDTTWGVPSDLGAGFQIYMRRKPARRSAPSRIYTKAGEWVIFVSEAEVDSARRTVEEHADDDRVEPPDRGIVSLAARAEPLVPLIEKRFSAVADALSGATRIDANADADDRGLRATLEVHFTNEADASDARARAEPLVAALRKSEGLFGLLAGGARTTVVGPSLVVRIDLGPKEFGALAAEIGARGSP